MSRPSDSERLIEYLRGRGPVKLSDIAAAGISGVVVLRMTESGQVVRLGRGRYQLAPNLDLDQHRGG